MTVSDPIQAPAGISEPQLAFIKDLVFARSAITLDGDKAYLVEARLSGLVRASGQPSINAFVDELRARNDHPLLQRVVEAMTTNETTFFRDLHPFDALRNDVFPTLRLARSGLRSLDIWSAAASTGQEAYSIAMLLQDSFPDITGSWRVRIAGTDLSTATVARATEGRFDQLEVNRGLPASLLVKHFDREGEMWRIKPALRAMTHFSQHNLAEPWKAMPRFDVIFLRNVLIYFNIATKRAIFAQIKRVLAPDGYLFLGGAETTLRIDDDFDRIESGKSAFYRVGKR